MWWQRSFYSPPLFFCINGELLCNCSRAQHNHSPPPPTPILGLLHYFSRNCSQWDRTEISSSPQKMAPETAAMSQGLDIKSQNIHRPFHMLLLTPLHFIPVSLKTLQNRWFLKQRPVCGEHT